MDPLFPRARSCAAWLLAGLLLLPTSTRASQRSDWIRSVRKARTHWVRWARAPESEDGRRRHALVGRLLAHALESTGYGGVAATRSGSWLTQARPADLEIDPLSILLGDVGPAAVGSDEDVAVPDGVWTDELGAIHHDPFRNLAAYTTTPLLRVLKTREILGAWEGTNLRPDRAREHLSVGVDLVKADARSALFLAVPLLEVDAAASLAGAGLPTLSMREVGEVGEGPIEHPLPGLFSEDEAKVRRLYARAFWSQAKALEIRRDAFTPLDEDTFPGVLSALDALGSLMATYLHLPGERPPQRILESAEAAHAERIDLVARFRGQHSKELVLPLEQQARFLAKLGRLDEGVAIWERVVELYRRGWGPHSEQFAWAHVHLGEMLEAERPEAAEGWYRQALGFEEEQMVLGQALARLAWLARRRGDVAEAAELQRRRADLEERSRSIEEAPLLLDDGLLGEEDDFGEF